MRHLKKFEHMYNIGDIRIGDYVLLDIDFLYIGVSSKTNKHKFFLFVNNNIGKITNIRNSIVTIQYKNIPSDVRYVFDMYDSIDRHISDIKYYAKTIDELELKIVSTKYNI
jgi:hypothetical protein